MASTNNAPAPKIVYYLGVLRTAPGQTPVELIATKDLTSFSFFTRTNAEQAMTFTAKTVAERIAVGTRTRVEEKTADVHAYQTSAGFCAILMTQSGYEEYTAQAMLSKTVDQFKSRFTATEIKEKDSTTLKWPELETLRKEAETAEQTGMGAVQRELNETKIVLHKTIQTVLERGEKLETLVQKSDDLGAMSKGFYKTAKQQNSCCIVM